MFNITVKQHRVSGTSSYEVASCAITQLARAVSVLVTFQVAMQPVES
jgi:hypothetical protein